MKQKQNCHTYIYVAGSEDEGYKLVDYLREKQIYSHRLINAIKKEGSIHINNIRTRFNHILKENDEIVIDFGIEKYDAECVKIDFEVIHEDDDVLIICKPANLITHPTKYHQSDTLANGIYYMWRENKLLCKARFVNRLDMDTSGVILIAKNKYSHHFIQKQMQEGKIAKTYFALAEGCFEGKKGIIDVPIGKIEDDSTQRTVFDEGKESITEYEVVTQYDDYALVKIILHTGRTHQIRVHMQYINHPLLGDILYNKKSDLIDRQALHAFSIGFIHPRTKQYNVYTAPLADDIARLLK
ncbi:MAG: RluA family pseudouridine synthase [Eubacteriaceae bacterium]